MLPPHIRPAGGKKINLDLGSKPHRNLILVSKLQHKCSQTEMKAFALNRKLNSNLFTLLTKLKSNLRIKRLGEFRFLGSLPAKVETHDL